MKQWNFERGTRLAAEEVQRQLAVTEQTTDMVATLDIDGFLLTLNQAGCELLGIDDASQLHKLRIAGFYEAESRRQLVESDIPNACRHLVWRSERILVGKDYNMIPCSQILVAHKSGQGSVEFFSLIIHDITAIKTAEEERNNLREQLFQSKKMETVGKLAGGVAHDFNNFLTVIMGYAELGLLNKDTNEEIRGDLRVILDTAQKAARLTAQLLDYSSKKMIEPQVLELNDVIQDSEQLLHSMLGEKIALEFKLDIELWPIHFDRSQLEQILFNLAVNARDAMQGSGTFRISTKNCEFSAAQRQLLGHMAPGDYVRLTVEDDGVGMDATVMGQIFEPFFTTKEKGKGTGLGLAAVYGSVKQNGGEIRVLSEPGKGTAFEIIIPAYRQEQAPSIVEPDPLNRAVAPSKGRETILLVEDNLEVRGLLTQTLENLGYEVIAARDGMEGEVVFEQQRDRIDLLVSDIVMPGKDGIQLAHQCLKARPELKVLLISGHNDEIVYFRNRNQRHIRMLNKPFAPQRLAAEVRAMLESGEEDAV